MDRPRIAWRIYAAAVTTHDETPALCHIVKRGVERAKADEE